LPAVSGGPDRNCVANTKATLASRNLSTTHLISIGGWDAPHPETTNPPNTVYESWVQWNDGLYEGFDWDIEGNDDLSSPYNYFTSDCLNLMGIMSQLAKQDGFIVSMAPAESYLDVTTGLYDQYLTHNYPEWETLQPEFHYHGRNIYGYLLSSYGLTSLNKTANWASSSEVQTITIPTFDFISIQLYESYTHAVYNVSILGTSPSDYLIQYIPSLYRGWDVSFSNSSSPTHLTIPPTQLVIGLANGWADGAKSLLVWPEEVGAAYEHLSQSNLQPRGFMFWDIADEGRVVTGTDRELWMASGLNEFLHTRP
jgi:chitinase